MVHMRLNGPYEDNKLSKPQKKKDMLSSLASLLRTWNKTEFQIFHIGLSEVTSAYFISGPI